MKDLKLVIVGNIAYDINTFPDKEKGTKNNGGAGYYSAIPASLFTRTGIVSRIGNDFDILTMKHCNIDLKGLKTISSSPTTKFYHTYLTEDGQLRTFIPEIYEDTTIRPEDFPKEYFNAQYIHIATNPPKIQKQFIELIRKNSNAQISIDTHEAYYKDDPNSILEVFDTVDIAFIDKEFTRPFRL